MAAAAVAEGQVLRCPVCLAPQTVRRESRSSLICPSCFRVFRRENALPLPAGNPASAPEATPQASAPVRWTGHIAAAAGLLALTLWLGMGMKGPGFLGFYFVVWLVTFFGSLVLRRYPWFSHSGSVALVVFEGLGVSRLITGLQAGMHRFEYLILMMFIGGWFYLLRSDIEGDGGPGGGSSSSGCGSSCGSSGGGGCGGGGGGCGGCGGS